MNYSKEIEYEGEEAKEGIPSNIFVSPEIIEKANQYVISLVGEEYFKNKFTLSNLSYHSKNTIIYDYFLGQVTLRLNTEGNVREYQGPTKPYSFNIDKEEAVRIAKSKGLQEPITAQLVYGGLGFDSDAGTITESYMWDVSSQKYSEGNLWIIYVDIDTGDIIGVKTFVYAPVREWSNNQEEFNKTDKEYNKPIEETNKTDKPFNQTIEKANRIGNDSSKKSLLSNIIKFFRSIFNL